MRYYTWFQAMRMFAGMEPGPKGIPQMVPAAPEPANLYELLGDGVAAIVGVPTGAAIHEEIPPKAWLRMSRVAFEPRAHDSMFYESVVNLPGVPTGLRYRDLLFTEAGIDALKAEMAKRSCENSAPQSLNADLLTLEDASLLMAEQTKRSKFVERQRLLALLHGGKIEWHYSMPIVEWQQQPLWLEPDANTVRRAATPHPQHWRVRRDQVVSRLMV